MDFIKKISSYLPFGKKEEEKEYFFALNIGQQNLTCALWELLGKHLRILETAKSNYKSLDEITKVTDRLLDTVVGNHEIEPQKILFGVPDGWLSEDDLKEEYLKLLKSIVKELELSPMAYVATSHALIHFLENKEGVPTTAILLGFEKDDLVVTVSRAGKSDGSKTVKRSDNPGLDVEKLLLGFTSVETLPSRILIYGQDEKPEKLKEELLSFAWMSKLSFLHFPKIDILEKDLEIKSVCWAGAKELREDAILETFEAEPKAVKPLPTEDEETTGEKEAEKIASDADIGFVVGDISKIQKKEEQKEVGEDLAVFEEKRMGVSLDKTEQALEAEEFEEIEQKKVFMPVPFLNFLKGFRPRLGIRSISIWVILGVLGLLIAGFIFIPKAHVKIFVEPQILEKDTEVIAEPSIKEVKEGANIIPGEIVEIEISGSGKGDATGEKEIGDPAKGTLVIYNKTFDSKSLSKGTTVTSPNGIKFSLDTSVNIASQSATDTGITFGKSTVGVLAQSIGADGNLPSGTEFSVANLPSSQVSAKAEGNFSGGTSKQATVVSETDQSRLLAQVAAELRTKAQQKLQENLKDKKVLEEALSEEIVKKTFSKKIGDQASDFSLNLEVKFKGTAFADKDLKTVVSRLVSKDVPEGFELNVAETESQADVSKLEENGKLIFLARFRAKVIPKLDLSKIKNQIKGKTPGAADSMLKEQSHILGSEIKIFPTLPSFLQLIPFLERNIEVEVGLK